MQTLTQQKQLHTYTTTINAHLQEEKKKSMVRFFTKNLPFLKDFHLEYTTHTTNLKEASKLEDILLSGLQDLFYIIKEDGFGFKEYKEIDAKYADALTQSQEKFEQIFPLFVDIAESEALQNSYEENKALEIHYNTLQNLRKLIHKRHKVNRYLTKLEWCFIKINLAVALIQLNNIDTYEELKKLEKKVRKVSKKLLKTAKKYDDAMQKLPYIKEEITMNTHLQNMEFMTDKEQAIKTIENIYNTPPKEDEITIAKEDLETILSEGKHLYVYQNQEIPTTVEKKSIKGFLVEFTIHPDFPFLELVQEMENLTTDIEEKVLMIFGTKTDTALSLEAMSTTIVFVA